MEKLIQVIDSSKASHKPFIDTINTLIELSEHDPEFREGIKYLDMKAQKDGVTIYDAFYFVLYDPALNHKAGIWRNSRN